MHVQEPFSEVCDVYSFAMLVFEVVTQQVPWAGKTPQQVQRALLKELRPSVPVEDAERCTELVALMEDCWHRHPTVRVRAQGLSWGCVGVRTCGHPSAPLSASSEMYTQ